MPQAQFNLVRACLKKRSSRGNEALISSETHPFTLNLSLVTSAATCMEGIFRHALNVLASVGFSGLYGRLRVGGGLELAFFDGDVAVAQVAAGVDEGDEFSRILLKGIA